MTVESYDSRAVLKDFAQRKDIQFPLLSDADSGIIRRFGILNTPGKGELKVVWDSVSGYLCAERPRGRHRQALLLLAAGMRKRRSSSDTVPEVGSPLFPIT